MVLRRSSRNRSESSDAGAHYGNEIRMEQERVLNTYDDDLDYITTEALEFDLKKYCKRIEVVVVNDLENGMSLDFDLINVEAPIANALRRVLLAEVPTMAIEKVYLYQNTSVIQVRIRESFYLFPQY
uniref:RPOLD domain-containing protein n=1 Tax=Angiostrongylus cantonensis TaxID=6313 RepID=A0A0K0DCV9_ANGCA